MWTPFSVDWTSLHRTDGMMLFLRLKKANSSGMNPIAHLRALHKCILNGMVHKISISWMFGAFAKENRYVPIHVFFISHRGKSKMISLDLLFSFHNACIDVWLTCFSNLNIYFGNQCALCTSHIVYSKHMHFLTNEIYLVYYYKVVN